MWGFAGMVRAENMFENKHCYPYFDNDLFESATLYIQEKSGEGATEGQNSKMMDFLFPDNKGRYQGNQKHYKYAVRVEIRAVNEKEDKKNSASQNEWEGISKKVDFLTRQTLAPVSTLANDVIVTAIAVVGATALYRG